MVFAFTPLFSKVSFVVRYCGFLSASSHISQVSARTSCSKPQELYDDFIYEDPVPRTGVSFPVSDERGIHGVFDVGDLVTLLRDRKAFDICTMRVPKEKQYVDFMVICTGLSTRHVSSITSDVLMLYKRRKTKSDSIPDIGERRNHPWQALDMGNIVLHILTDDLRKFYDIDSLWICGPEFDDNLNSNTMESISERFTRILDIDIPEDLRKYIPSDLKQPRPPTKTPGPKIQKETWKSWLPAYQDK